MKHIGIHEPCSEKWDQMTPTQKGAFCQKCALEVHDFTNKSPEYIRSVLKEHIGQRVCGRIKNTQVDDLNNSFDSWKMNNQRSIQRAMLFSLMVVFGLTLFSCEEEEEESTIGQVQEIGMKMIRQTDETPTIQATQKQVTMVQGQMHAVEIPDEPIELDELMIGEIAEREYILPQVDVVEKAVEKDIDVYVTAGVMISTHQYDQYLERIPNVHHQTENIEGPQVFEALAYPNPTRANTTLKVDIPKKQRVQIKLFDMSGRFLENINSRKLDVGTHEFNVDLGNQPNGMYLITIISKDYKETVRVQKM